MPQITWTLQGCLPNSPPGCCDGEGRDTGRTALRGWDPEAMKRAKAARLPANKGDLLAWPAPPGGAGGPCHPTATLLHRGRALQSGERTCGLTALQPAPSLLPKGPLLPGKSPGWWPRGVPGAVLGREEGGEMQRPNFHSPPWVSRCWRVLSKESAPKKRSVFQPGCHYLDKKRRSVFHIPPSTGQRKVKRLYISISSFSGTHGTFRCT